MNDTMKDLVRQLTAVQGPSGYEGLVRDVIRTQVEPLADVVRVDRLGNLHAVVRGQGSGLRVMVAAHMDEIGLMVSALDGAFLRVTKIGGIDKRALTQDRQCIKREVDRVLPFFRTRGHFVPSLDHSIPPDVPFVNFQWYLEYLRQYE